MSAKQSLHGKKMQRSLLFIFLYVFILTTRVGLRWLIWLNKAEEREECHCYTRLASVLTTAPIPQKLLKTVNTFTSKGKDTHD